MCAAPIARSNATSDHGEAGRFCRPGLPVRSSRRAAGLPDRCLPAHSPHSAPGGTPWPPLRCCGLPTRRPDVARLSLRINCVIAAEGCKRATVRNLLAMGSPEVQLLSASLNRGPNAHDLPASLLMVHAQAISEPIRDHGGPAAALCGRRQARSLPRACSKGGGCRGQPAPLSARLCAGCRCGNRRKPVVAIRHVVIVVVIALALNADLWMASIHAPGKGETSGERRVAAPMM